MRSTMATRQPTVCSRNRGPPRQMRCEKKTRRALRRRLQGDGPSPVFASTGSEAQSRPTMAVADAGADGRMARPGLTEEEPAQ